MTALYRHFDAANELLYVGISLSVAHRLSQHMRGSRWSGQIARVTVEHFATRDDALQAEERAIKVERPRFNVVHNNTNKPSRRKYSGLGLAILDETTGRWDGWYFFEPEATQMLEFFKTEWPEHTFRIADAGERGSVADLCNDRLRKIPLREERPA